MQDEERHGKLKQALEQLMEVKTQSEERQEKLKQALAQIAETNDDSNRKMTTQPETTKGIYPTFEEKGAIGGADIQQFPMIQATNGDWVWRSWTPKTSGE